MPVAKRTIKLSAIERLTSFFNIRIEDLEQKSPIRLGIDSMEKGLKQILKLLNSTRKVFYLLCFT